NVVAAVREGRQDQLHRILDEGRDGDGLERHRAGAVPGEALDAPYRFGASLRGHQDPVRVRANPGGLVAVLLDQLGEGDDRVEGVVEVVGDAGRDLAEAREPLRAL